MKKESLHFLPEEWGQLPQGPGCYLFSASEKILYVGKAKNLRRRVRSYFQKEHDCGKTRILVRKIRGITIQTTQNEAEALILENNLIKKYRPPYNIRLRDDKTYPYIEVNDLEPYPRPILTRKPQFKKGRRHFGPFPEGYSIKQVLLSLYKIYKWRDCSLAEFKRRKTPCLLFQMEQCSAPCTQEITPQDYKNSLERGLRFFKAQGKSEIKKLTQKMHQHAQEEKFEQAIILRENIHLLENFLANFYTQGVEFLGKENNFDVLGYAKNQQDIVLCLYQIRDKILIGKRYFHFKAELNDWRDDVFSLLSFFYQESPLDISALICDFNLHEFTHEDSIISLGVSLKKPRAPFKLFFERSCLEAQERLGELRQKSLRIKSALKQLSALMEDLPLTKIECYDIAVWQGDSPTAAQIVLGEDGLERENYRHYHLTPRPEGNNDFAMLQEVAHRRRQHGNYPDLFLIDGGKAQVQAFQKGLQENIPCIGIAKERKAKGTSERLILPHHTTPYIIENREVLQLVTLLRDEAHRFCRRLHHRAEKKRLFKN